jgi:predicted dehydrogenase
MRKVRIGIVGLGNIGRFHASNLLEGKIRNAELTAVCTRQVAPFGPGSRVRLFTELERLLDADAVDAVLIATPHPCHVGQGIAALQAGAHVLMEKPIASHKADAERLIAVHRDHPRAVFGMMFQFRVQPRYRKMREMVQAGELGRILRVNWINTDWFRPDAYYASSAWRATWKGEGGGVLINQCLHNLDALQWICGMPSEVRGFCRFGRHHSIEVEDEATALFEWDSGATGVFIGSTGEVPGTNRFEIAGTLGRLVLEADRLLWDRNEQDASELCKTARNPFETPAVQRSEVPFDVVEEAHVLVLQNFVDAILGDVPLIAPGAEGLNSLELANAVVFASLLGEAIRLPLDGAAWETTLGRLAAESTVKKRVVPTAAGDVTTSFKG